MTQDLKVDVNSLTLNAKEVPYTFGQLASVNPNGGYTFVSIKNSAYSEAHLNFGGILIKIK